MSKRWKVRQRNAAKREKSREVIVQFYSNVIAELERLQAMSSEERARLLKAANGEAP
jgi:hypothetical protein